MSPKSTDRHQDIRDGIRALCAQFPGEYHRKVDQAKAYPEDFVNALIREHWFDDVATEA